MMNSYVRVTWHDAKIYSPKQKTIGISLMETVGIMEKEYDDYILIRSPKTISIRTQQKHPEKEPEFYLIPKGMIKSIETN